MIIGDLQNAVFHGDEGLQYFVGEDGSVFLEQGLTTFGDLRAQIFEVACERIKVRNIGVFLDGFQDFVEGLHLFRLSGLNSAFDHVFLITVLHKLDLLTLLGRDVLSLGLLFRLVGVTLAAAGVGATTEEFVLTGKS